MHNDFSIKDDVVYISLNGGFIAMIDKHDLEKISDYNWYKAKRGNADGVMSGETKRIKMHRLILEAPRNMEVDHINRNPLDNRRCNLRLCNRFQNARNTAGSKKSSSKYKGVFWRGDRKKWAAQISIGSRHTKKRSRHIGLFDTEDGAALAYNKMAKDFFGEFAYLNEIL